MYLQIVLYYSVYSGTTRIIDCNNFTVFWIVLVMLKLSGFRIMGIVKSLSRVRLFATWWTVAYQAPPSVGFSRQEYWSGLPFPSPGGLHDPGIEPRPPALEADTLTSEPPGNALLNGH